MEKLTPQEEQALQVVFKIKEGNVKSILENLDQELPYTTVASTVKNLEKKGFLRSRMIGNTYLYKPALTEQEFKKKYVGGMVKDYFANSYKELVNFFVEQKKLSTEELKDILKMIENGQ